MSSGYEVADVSADPNARALANVSDALRSSVVDLGCTPAGYLGSWNGHLGFVTEVLHHATEPVVVALYNFSTLGEGVAFWTMLDDGTIVTTERLGRDHRVFALVSQILPRHGTSTRFFSKVHRGTPAHLLAKHLAHVRANTRGAAKPFVAEPLVLYAAMRLRAGDMLLANMRHFRRALGQVFLAIFAGISLGLIAVGLVTRGWRAAVKVSFPAVVVAAIVARWVAPPIARLATRQRGDISPVPPDVLLERASKMRRCNFDALVPLHNRP